MDKPIGVGDLVVVVHPKRCGCAESVGWIFIVQRIEPDDTRGRCWVCSGWHDPTGVPLAQHPNGGWCEVARLKRIPPLDELEGVEQDEGVTA